MKRKLFCIGFHKTGTTSLARALKILGYRVTGPNGIDDPDIAINVHSIVDSLVPKFDAFQDNPWPLVYQYLDKHWPDSRFILTVRDSQSWITSQVRHFGTQCSPMREWIYGVGCPQGNEDVYLKRYERHNAEVLEYFSDRPNQFAVLDFPSGDGWPELCTLLDEPIPGESFPHANKALERGSVSKLISSLLTKTTEGVRNWRRGR